MGTAASESGWTSPPQRLTTTLATADTTGETSMTRAAVRTVSPPRRARSSEKMTATPANPRAMPATAIGASRSPGRRKCASAATKSG